MTAIDGDFVLRSTNIFTMDDHSAVHDGAVLVRDGRIESLLPADAQTPYPVVDVGDRPVLPGFVDPHIHLEMSSAALWGAVDCHIPPCHSIDALVTQLREHEHLRDARGGWLVGQGGLFSDRRFAEKRMPDRHDLDKVSTSYPIAVRLGGHITVVNTLGLELATEHGLPTSGDAYVRLDEHGQPNGILHEMFYALPVPDLTEEQRRNGLRETAWKYLIERGVTAIGEMSNSVAGLHNIADGARSGEIPLWTEAFVWVPGTMSLDDVMRPEHRAEVLPESESGKFNIRGIKVFVDGGISAAGAALLRPYLKERDGKPNMGRMAYTFEQLCDMVRRADEQGLQIAAHVNGERSQRMLCDAAVEVRGDATGFPQVRLEHGGNMLTELETFDYWRKASAMPVPQAPGIWTVSSFVPEYTGEYMRTALRPFRTMLDHGWDISSSSDASGSENLNFNPLFGVQAAVVRESCIGEVINADERVSVTEALRMHTIAAAKALGVEHELGSIEPGKRADLAVLGEDPRVCDPKKIAGIDVDHVFINGRAVVSRN